MCQLTEQAIQYVTEYFESNGITMDNVSLRKRVEDWKKCHNIQTSAELAAMAISGPYIPGITKQEIKEIESFYFSFDETFETNNFSIYEIEEALRDIERWSCDE